MCSIDLFHIKVMSRISTYPVILGSFALYACSPAAARQVYEQLCANPAECEPFGTVRLDTGEEVDWVNMRAGVVRQICPE